MAHGEVVSFNTNMDLYVGEYFKGHLKCSESSDRMFGKLVALLVVCPDDMNPGWVNVRAVASEVIREGSW